MRKAWLLIGILKFYREFIEPNCERLPILHWQILRRHAPGHGIMEQVYLLFSFFCFDPYFIHGMLKYRELVNPFTKVINYSLDKPTGNPVAMQIGRLFHNLR